MNVVFLAQAQTVPQVADTNILQLIGGLGQSAAAVIMAYLFIAFLKKILSEQADRADERDKQQQARDDRLFSRFDDMVRDNGLVIRDNTRALSKFESSVDGLIRAVERSNQSHDGE